MSFPPDNLSLALCGLHYITTTTITTITLRTLCALHYRRFVAGNPALHYRNFATNLRYSVPVMTKTKIRFVHCLCTNALQKLETERGHTCKKRVMLRRRLFWPKKKIAEKVRQSRQNVNRNKSA